MSNLFKRYPLYRWSYIPGWPANIRHFFRIFKWAWQRCTRGFSDSDVWDFDIYLAEVIAGGLEELAKSAHGYPDTAFETFEDWTEALRANAAIFRDYLDGDFNTYKKKAEAVKDSIINFIGPHFTELWD